MRVAILNKISRETLRASLGEFDEVPLNEGPDVVFVRSAKLKAEELPSSVLAIGRAGTGVNNIPIDWCNDHGVAVFNAPGANANAVRELVCAALVISARPLIRAAMRVEDLMRHSFIDGTQFPDVEKEKSQFQGTEIGGKTIFIVGLGKIGREVAHLCLDLRMKVVEGARVADFVSLHPALSKETRGMIHEEFFRELKPGARLLNFARSEVVNVQALRKALIDGIVSVYVSDFPEMELAEFINSGKLIFFPHLGASTVEAEENAGTSVARSVANFMQDGTVENSSNFPSARLSRRQGTTRLLVSNQNAPGAIASVTDVLSKMGLNVDTMLNRALGTLAYNLIDIDNSLAGFSEAVDEIAKLPAILRVRVVL